MLEKHPAPGKEVKVHCCSLCDFSTARECYIPYHMKRKHREEYDMLMSNEQNSSVNRSEDEEVVEELDETDDGIEYIEEVVGGGIVGRLQSQINSLAKRYKSLVPKEIKLLSNLLEMREVAKSSGIDSSHDMVSSVGIRSRKRKSIEVFSEPSRQSPRLMDAQSESTPQLGEGELEGELAKELEKELERELPEEDDEDIENFVKNVISDCIKLVVAEERASVTTKANKKCTVCGKVFSLTGNLNVHMVALHTVLSEPVKCSKKFCFEEFATMYDMLVHRSLCDFKCGGCGKRIRKACRVEGHMRKCVGNE